MNCRLVYQKMDIENLTHSIGIGTQCINEDGKHMFSTLICIVMSSKSNSRSDDVFKVLGPWTKTRCNLLGCQW